MNINPKSISDTRIQLHWASQLLSSAADAMLEKADDDSHSNLGWDSETSRLVGRAESAIGVNRFELHQAQDSMSLNGKTWKRQKIGSRSCLEKNSIFENTRCPHTKCEWSRVFLSTLATWSPSANGLQLPSIHWKATERFESGRTISTWGFGRRRRPKGEVLVAVSRSATTLRPALFLYEPLWN